jgi:hypothetical protein
MVKRRDVYFLGTIVLTENQEGALEVADGQQRLATSTLILAAMRDIFLGLNDEMRARSIEEDFLFTIDINNREKISRLTLNADDNQFFCSTILLRPKERDKTMRPTRRSHELLSSAFAAVRKHLESLKSHVGEAGFSDALLGWRKFLLQGATVIVLTVPDELDAFVMFETLNDRGLKTSQADLVKNFLFKEAGTRKSEAQTLWSAMRGVIESIGDDDLTIDFLRHVCNLLYGQTRERDVFEKIQKGNRGPTEAIRLLTLLSGLAGDYAAILNPDHPKWNPYPPSIRASVKTLNLLNVSQIRPLLLGVAYSLAPKHAADAFQRCVAWTMRFIVCGGGRGGDLERKYCDMAHAVFSEEIKTSSELDIQSVGVVPTDAQFQASFQTIRVNVSKLARYMLRELENTARGDGSTELEAKNAPTVNLEHVMPDTQCPDWPNVTLMNIETHTNRLGNLCLLLSTVNVQIDRAAFAEKKKAYAASPLLLTSQIATVGKWDIEEIENRQRVLAELAVRTWKISNLPQPEQIRPPIGQEEEDFPPIPREEKKSVVLKKPPTTS